MRLSRLLSQTRREQPADVEGGGLRLLVQAGFVQPLGGQLGLLPPAERVLAHLTKKMTNLTGGPEMQVINLPPVEDSLAELPDLLRSHMRSYRQFPLLLCQQGFSTSGRKVEWYGLNAGQPSQAEQAQVLKTAVSRLLSECGIPHQIVESDPGLTGGLAVEWLALLPGADLRLLGCETCGYAAAEETARFSRRDPDPETLLPLEKVATPHCFTIQDLARLLQVPEVRTAKAVFLMAALPNGQEKLLFVVTRGEREVSEALLRQVTGARVLRPAEEAEIRAVGAVPGYASPVGLKDVWVVVESAIPVSPNLVAGANEEGYHYLNVNYGRDYTARQVGQFARARPWDPCPHCGAPLSLKQGMTVACLRQPGEVWNARAGCNYRNENGQNQPVLINSLRLELENIMLAAAENHRDDRGLCWPTAAAPWALHLVLLSSKTGQPEAAAEELYRQLCQAGLEPLYDDRSESAGVKFNDADLMGMPVRLTVSERSLKQGGVEIKLRPGGEIRVVGLEQILAEARALSAGFE